MQITSQYPRKVREVEHIEIAMPDSTRLAVRVWFPKIFEYPPDSKNDGTLAFETTRAPYIAGHSYAHVRVDIRGCGGFEGEVQDD